MTFESETVNQLRSNMKLVGENKGFEVFFDYTNQVYNVFKEDKFLIGNKFRFREVKCYLD